MIIGRVAHLTQSPSTEGENVNIEIRCSRGCPYGAYFSSNAVTLPAANATGNLTIRPYSIVQSIIYDDKLGKATGVRIIDAETNETPLNIPLKSYFAMLLLLSTTQILVEF